MAGHKKSGRPKGSKNKRLAYIESNMTRNGLTPLDYMLRVLRDEATPMHIRLLAARDAAPYCHRKLPQALEHSGPGGKSVSFVIAGLSSGIAGELTETTDANDNIIDIGADVGLIEGRG